MANYIGIDNGLDGGITVLNEEGSIIHKCVMPVIKLGKGRQVDILEMDRIINAFSPCSCILEPAQKHSPGILALCSTWFSYGIITSVLTLGKTRFTLVNPQAWQKMFWVRPKMAKGQKFDTKAAALNAANKLWPSEDWTKSERASKPHDGMVDAALIAEYGRRLNL
jgi:hypothetical protein